MILFSFAAIKEEHQLLEAEPFKSNKLLYPSIFVFPYAEFLYLRIDVLLHAEYIFEEITHCELRNFFWSTRKKTFI